MPIRLKQTTNTSDQFYPLDEKLLSDNNKVGMKDPNSKTVRTKLTPFVKNVLKSTKNLAFDVVDEYVPNLKEVKGSFKETVESAREDMKNDFGPLIDKARAFASKKENGESFKDKFNKEKKEIVDRLKSGKFYTSIEDELSSSFGLDDFGDFGDFGDFSAPSDSYAMVSEPDVLSDEPFSGVHKGAVKSINVSAKNRELRNRTTTIRPTRRTSSGGSSQLRLGDELVSDTTSMVGNSVLKKQDEVWARTYAADKQNFERLYGYQNEILRGVNSIVEFNNNVMSNNVAAQLEFQGKLLAAQQDSLNSLKELKDAVVVTSTYRTEETEDSLNSKIANSSVGLNGKAYWENIKKNFKDVAGSNAILSSLMMAPMMGDMFSMSEDTGMKVINPLNMASSGLFKMFLSKNTKNRLMDFNELLSNFGGLFTGKMNMLSRYGKGPAKTIGRLLGARESTVSVLNNGLSDPNEVVGWTSKSDRTLNEVIPTLLAKQLAVMSGKDELVYDYKDGKFKTSKSIKEEVKLRRSMAYENADTVRYTDAMSSYISTNKGLSKEVETLGGGKEVGKYIKTITNNLIKTGQLWDPELVSFNENYRNSVLDGVPDNLRNAALKAFTTAYSQMSEKETLRFNGAIRNVSMNLQKRMDSINADYKTYGGANAVVESGLEDEIAEKKRSLTFDLSMQLSPKEIEDAKNGRPSAHYIQVKNERMRRQMEIRKLESTVSGSGVTASVEGFGEISGAGSTGTSGIPNSIDKIFRLLTLGIPVYDQGNVLPEKLIRLRKEMNTLDARAAKEKADMDQADKDFQDQMYREKTQLYTDQVRFKRNQKVMQNNFMSYILPSGNSNWQQTNVINRGANKFIDATSGAFGKLLGSGYGGGEGLLGDVSYEEIDRQNLENATNALTTQRDKILAKIEADKGNPKAEGKNKARQKIVDLLNKTIDSNQKRLDAINNGKDSSAEASKTDAFVKALDSAIGEFSNKYIMQTHEIKEGTSIKDQFADVLDKGKAMLSDNGTKVVAKGKNIANKISSKAESLGTKAQDKFESVFNKSAAIYKNLDYHKVVDIVRENNIKTAEEFKEFASKHETLKKYTFFVSKLFSTGALRNGSDGEIVATPRTNVIIDIFEKREEAGITTTGRYTPPKQPTATNASYSLTGARVPSNVSTKLAIVPIDAIATTKAKTEKPKQEKKKLEVKALEIQKESGKSKARDIFVDANGTVIDNSSGSEMNFREYKGLKTALVVNGYENANNLSDDELYALVGSIKGPTGDSLRTTSDYRLLKKRVEAKARQESKKESEVKAKGPAKAKRKVDPSEPWAIYYPKMLMNGTLRYKNIMQILQPRSGQSVYGLSKEALFAMITALPENTGDDTNLKAVITRTKEFKHLKSNYRLGFTDKLKNAFDVKRNFRRMTRNIRLFKYKQLLNILDMMNIGEDDGYFRNNIDDKYVLKGIIEALGNSNPGSKQNKIYNSIIMTKAYLKLAKDTVTGSSRKEIKQKRKEINNEWRHGGKMQLRYGSLISVLRAANIKGKNFNYFNLKEPELLALCDAAMKDIPSIANMAEYKALKKEVNSKFPNKSKDPNKFSDSVKSFIKDLGGTVDGMAGAAANAFGAVGPTSTIEEIAKYLKVVALNSWYNLTGTLKNFANAAKEGFQNIRNVSSEEESNDKSRTSRSFENISASIYARLTGDQDLINRTRLLNAQNVNLLPSPLEDDVNEEVEIIDPMDTSDIPHVKTNQVKRNRHNGKKKSNKRGKAAQRENIREFKRKYGTGPNYYRFVPNAGEIVLSPNEFSVTDDTKALVPAVKKDLNKLRTKTSSDKTLKGELRKNSLVIANQNGVDNAILYSTLAQAEMMASMLKLMGFRDDGKLNEKDKETVAGYLQNIQDNGGTGGGDGDNPNTKWYDKAFNFAKGAGAETLIKTGALTIAGIGLAKRIKDGIKHKDKNTGFETFGNVLGLSDDDVKDKWFDAERAGNIKNVTRYGVMSGGALFKGIGTGLKKGLASAKTGPATVTNAIAKVKEAPKQAWEIIKEGLEKFLKDPKLLKRLGPDLVKKIKSLPSLIASKFKSLGQMAKGGISSYKNGIKAIPVAGWIIAVADAIWSFASGMNDAPKYFTISPNDTTAGMRTTAGLVKMIKSILQSLLSITGVGAAIAIGIDFIVPDEWLVTTVYNLVASKADEEELKIKQADEARRAKALGTDAKTLAKAENNSLWSKMGSGIHAAVSKKTYKEIQAEKTAKKLGMSVEDYTSLNDEYNLNKDTSRKGNFDVLYPEFAKLRSAKDAVKAFTNSKTSKKLKSEADSIFRNNDWDAVEKIYSAINDNKLGSQNDNADSLNPKFKKKIEKFLNDKDISKLGISINEAKRNPFTQFAYYAKGRTNDLFADKILKLAGFESGLNFWGGDNSINTKTLNSNHLGGNAFDINTAKLSKDDINLVGKVANKYGIAWGGNWKGFKDYPHFEDNDNKSPVLMATGGIVNARGVSTPRNYLLDTGDKVRTRLNPGEMVLTKTQQTALFNRIKRMEYEDMKGTSAKNPVMLNESPMLTDAKDTLTILNQAIEIQNKIYEEQTRHNKVSENFYEAVLKLVAAVAGSRGQANKYVEQIDSITSALTKGSYGIASGY